MAVEQDSAVMAEQIATVVYKAREQFADCLEEYFGGKKVDAGFTLEDKSGIERLFSEVVNTYLIAEMAAIVSYSVYRELKDDRILTGIAPALLEQYESKIGQAADSLVKKTAGLPDLAQGALESKSEKSVLVSRLLRDISDMKQMKPIRASFDGDILNFMGE